MFFAKYNFLKVLNKRPTMFRFMYLKWPFRLLFQKFSKKRKHFKKYAGVKKFPDYVGNEIIKNYILSGEPFAVGRPGATEIHLMLNNELIKHNIIKEPADEKYERLYVNSGIFPRNIEFIKKYAPYAEKCLSECDALNVSYCVMEDYYYYKNMKKDAKLMYIRALDYWRFENPWTMALKGKKVLVISPFADSISKQYKKREKLYKNPKFLPEFTLYTVKAVQTGGYEKDDRFNDWFEALQYMYDEAMKYDFDIAILSCGAYSLPLTTMFKKAGKGAIHMGAVCQMLFGIKGRRFEDEPGASDFFNEHWVYPSKEETPKSANSVENHAYW